MKDILFDGIRFRPTFLTKIGMLLKQRPVDGYFISPDFPKCKFFFKIENKPFFCKVEVLK